MEYNIKIRDNTLSGNTKPIVLCSHVTEQHLSLQKKCRQANDNTGQDDPQSQSGQIIYSIFVSTIIRCGTLKKL